MVGLLVFMYWHLFFDLCIELTLRKFKGNKIKTSKDQKNTPFKFCKSQIYTEIKRRDANTLRLASPP